MKPNSATRLKKHRLAQILVKYRAGMQKNIIKTILLFLFVFISGPSLFAQTDSDNAANNAKQALVYEGNGKTMEAIPFLKKAIQLDSGNINYPYELAVAYYNVKEYAEAKKILEGLLDHRNIFALVYHLLGNVYDDMGKPDLAIKTYENGLKKYPGSAELYYEMGNMLLKNKDYKGGLQFYEKGIKANPLYPSNYYRAAKLFCISNESVWGMIYGEIFMNLEKNTERTAEMSKLLYNTYIRQIKKANDGSFTVNFSNTLFSVKDTARPSFAKFLYEPTIRSSMRNEKNIDVDALCRMRKKFVETFINSNLYLQYPNALFTYQYKVLKAGHIDAYNHWVLAEGDTKAYKEWLKHHQKNWDNFGYWIRKNRIPLDDNYKFFREQY